MREIYLTPFDIRVPCIKISNIELIFEQYRMVFHRDKYDIEVQNDEAIKRNRFFFDFMLGMFNHLNLIYVKEFLF